MSNEPEKKPDSTIAQVAGYGAGASFGIAAIAFFFMHEITDLGMFAIAITAAAPSAMAFGICTALIKSAGNKPPQ